MLNLRHFRRLAASGKQLRLDSADQLRFLWSYYGSRLPGAAARREAVQEIVVRNRQQPLRLAIRTNAVDADFVDEIFARGVYEFGIPGVKTILDLGGNIGYASLFFHLSFPAAAVACVEPVPANIRMIKRNFALNPSSVRLFEAAVGPEDGSTEFQLLLSDPGSGSLTSTGVMPAAQSEIITVPVISVPTLMKALGWERIDLLKLDIEGGERQLLANRPPWLSKVGAIIGEGHLGYAEPYTVERMTEQLSPFGFRVNLLEDRGGAFVFVADSDASRVAKLPSCLSTNLKPVRKGHAKPQ